MMKNRFILLLLMVVIVGCNSKQTSDIVNVRYVKTGIIDPIQVVSEINFNGKVREKREIELSFRVNGPIVYFPFKEGDFVKKGDVIARIDDRDYKTNVAASKAQYDQLQGEYNRYCELLDVGKVPENTFEKIKSGYLRAKADYEHAVDQLNDTELISPISGYIYKKNINNHENILQGMSVVSLIDVSDMEVSVFVPESQIVNVSDSKDIFCSIPNANISRQPVTLISIDKKSGKNDLYEARYALGVNNKNIISGMSCRVSLYISDADSTIKIPIEALWNDAHGDGVWIYNKADSSVTKRSVTLGNIVSGAHIEIKQGLKSGEEIVVAGVNSIRDDMKIIPIAPKSETNVGDLL